MAITVGCTYTTQKVVSLCACVKMGRAQEKRDVCEVFSFIRFFLRSPTGRNPTFQGLARWKEVDLLSHSTAWLFYLPRFSWYSIYRCNSADSDQVVVGDVWVKKRLGFFDLERRTVSKALAFSDLQKANIYSIMAFP